MENQYQLTITGQELQNRLDAIPGMQSKAELTDNLLTTQSSRLDALEARPAGGDLRFSAVVRDPGVTVNTGRPKAAFTVVWLDASATSAYAWNDTTSRYNYPYTTPDAAEPALTGRFAARVDTSGVTASSSADTDVPVSTVSYYDDWEGRDDFCTAAGAPLRDREYLCIATGRRYAAISKSSTALTCIAAPPADAKQALFRDLWDEACMGGGWGTSPDYSPNHNVFGYYDRDMDAYRLNSLDLTYPEALRVYYAGHLPNTPMPTFYGGNPFIRTNLPARVINSNFLQLSETFLSCSSLEVANIDAGRGGDNGSGMFYANNRLRKVIGTLFVGNGGTLNPAPYSVIPLLAEFKMYWGSATSYRPLDLRNLPALNAASLEYMITNSPALSDTTKNRTCTLHADAYNRLTDDMRARAAEKSITFVSAG